MGRSRKKQLQYLAEDVSGMDRTQARRWLVSSRPQLALQAKARLVAFPWAGSTARVYSKWDVPELDIVMVMLPGRDG